MHMAASPSITLKASQAYYIIASYPVPISIPTSTREGNRAWQHWGVEALHFRYVTIHVTGML